MECKCGRIVLAQLEKTCDAFTFASLCSSRNHVNLVDLVMVRPGKLKVCLQVEVDDLRMLLYKKEAPHVKMQPLR